MIITESFVMLNYPKTGTTFARKVIIDLYANVPRRRWWGRQRYCLDLILPNIRHPGEPDQHGCYCQIPKRYRNREIVAILRSPYDRFLSGYEFRHWAHFPPRPVEALRERFPTFPDLTLDEYVDFIDVEYGSAVGQQTFLLMQMFSSQLPTRATAVPSRKRVFNNLVDVTLLRQEHHTSDLIRFLERMGFSSEQTAFIEKHERLNVTPRGAEDRSQLWTPKALKYVSSAESLLFDILAARGINYQIPQAIAA